MSNGYPAHREADVVLHDGSTVHLRPVRGDDADGLREFLAGLGADSRAFRFFSGAADLERAAASFAEVDYPETPYRRPPQPPTYRSTRSPARSRSTRGGSKG